MTGDQWRGFLPCTHGYFLFCERCHMEDAMEISGKGLLATARASTLLKDSGERRGFATGAVRDQAAGKGRFDLLPAHALLLLAQQMERGALKYDDRNWEKGIPLSVFASSASRHLAKYVAGYDDEPHLSAALWNLACLAEGEERIRLGIWPKELDDLPHTYAGVTDVRF